ncbi:MAG: endonuclease/exonuclease/phosphatase family protein, partial [Flavobacteriaceae bacterium]|nr:endonuclease/exonuclease/phosphatase family protein [Flavobacteriaceae bacterium]
ARVISEIGADLSQNAPVILGLSEIENRKVLEDLANEPALLKYDYGIVHFDSPDRRGIDVALLYQKAHFRLIAAKAIPLIIYNKETGERIYTRDQLVVSGMMGDEKLHFIVNHWPSRRGGEERSRPGRLKAAELNKKIIDSLQATDPYAKIMSMGDFNDDPTNASFKEVLKTHRNPKKVPFMGLYNPMENMLRQGLGTLAYRDGWNLFDQIYMTKPMLEKDSEGWIFYKAGIYNKAYLANPRGQYKGYPFRATEGGYSDHFPVYIHIIKDITDLLEAQKN